MSIYAKSLEPITYSQLLVYSTLAFQANRVQYTIIYTFSHAHTVRPCDPAPVSRRQTPAPRRHGQRRQLSHLCRH